MARSFTAGSSQHMANANAIASPPFSVSLWFNPLATTGITRGLFKIGVGNNNNNFWGLFIDATEHLVARSRTSTQADSTSAGTVNASAWNHCVGLYGSSTNRQCYLNGTAATADTTSKAPAGADATEIGRLGAGINYATGYIAEVGVWSGTLTAADIAQLNHGFSPRLVRPDILVAFWPLMGRNSPEIDQWGKFDMTLTNAPPQAGHPRIILPRGRR